MRKYYDSLPYSGARDAVNSAVSVIDMIHKETGDSCNADMICTLRNARRVVFMAHSMIRKNMRRNRLEVGLKRAVINRLYYNSATELRGLRTMVTTLSRIEERLESGDYFV